MTMMLPGRAAAPEGPTDLRTMYAMHHGFRRDLTHFCLAVRRTPFAEERTWRASLARWDLLSTVLHDHHNKEDVVIWPLLRERAEDDGDTRAREVLDAMDTEHDLIDPLLERARDALRAAAADGRMVDRATLTAIFDETCDCICAHLAHEERDANAVLQARIGRAEWKELERTELQGGPAPRARRRALDAGCSAPSAVGVELR